MTSTGLLVVSNVKQIGASLRAIEKYVGKIYIHLNIPVEKCQPMPTWGHLISQMYADNSRFCNQSFKMSILVGSLRDQGINALQIKPVDMLFCDSHYPELCERMREHLNIPGPPIYLEQESNSTTDVGEYQDFKDAHKMYDTVVVGGTFDRIHVGHKIFLTQAVIRCCRRLVVGVTTKQMNKSKTLSELILPVEKRIEEVRGFLTEIDSSLQYEVVPIDDPFGPTQSDPNMDLIVVSAETERGGHKVNELRIKNNLRPLEIYCISLVESNDTGVGPKEKKVSSSNTRVDLLGTRLRQPEPRPNLPGLPYIIGLTGGIASGKSIMCNRLLKKGAQVLDCDKIAHEIYEPGQVCYTKIINHFGNDILDSEGRINRQKLGGIVFNDPKQLESLNNIVWPELLLEVKRRIRIAHAQHKYNIIVIEAAILLRAGWDSECHEVWSTIVTPELAVQRIMQRNDLSEEEARKRIASQMDNSEVVSKSHIVFSSQWSDEFTQEQVDKAWSILMQDIKQRIKDYFSVGNSSSNS
ncbi:PREDICTED: bifunctional coenzyme A synthase [Rhagoletis zephyria]|uniref:bifunctional coenzyme A synthase n=1 Tax=Rhagoletis zephyria TaxID=28612 RepID=UPI0008116DB1|nr:PREDICTED: bifunctional coenzyme A synthase [Rhagoletis zephyria]